MGAVASASTLTTWLSPYTSVPRRVPFTGKSPLRQRLAGQVVWSVVPTAMFWWWYLAAVRDTVPDEMASLRWAIPVAGLWITVGPVLMQHAEFILEHLLADFSREGARNGWNLSAIQRRIDWWDRIYYPSVLTIGVTPVLAQALSYGPLTWALPVQGPGKQFVGLLVITAVGLNSAAGIWGISKVVAIIHAAATTADLRWSPFRSDRAWGLRRLYLFAWSEGLMFSCGALFVPAILTVDPYLSPVSHAISWIFLVLLLCGGLMVFSIPVLLLRRLSLHCKAKTIDALLPAIEELTDRIDRLALRDTLRLDALLRLRQAIEIVNAAPFSFGFVGRAAVTLVLPTILTVFQVIGSR